MAKHLNAQYKGRIKINRRVVDGVVDISVLESNNANENLIFNSLSDIKINIANRGTFEAKAEYDFHLDVGETLTLVADIVDVSNGLTTFETMLVYQPDGTTYITEISTTTRLNGESRIDYTATQECRIRIRLGRQIANYTGVVSYSYIAILRGDFVTGTPPLPPSGQFVSGNSIILSDLYGHMFSTDDEGINTDRATITNKVIPYDDMGENEANQQFTSQNKQRVTYYKDPISGECEEKNLKFLGFKLGEFAKDLDGEFAIDSEGYYAREE